tara:strand:- start:5141 stop:6109 length:969 start_codon:yes stop_codon:yes gene_type:complete
MVSLNRDINEFLKIKDFSHNKFLFFGNEPALFVRAKNHSLIEHDLRLIEKVYLNIEDEDFDQKFYEAILSNSLFNEKKVIFIDLKKSRLNKVLISSLEILAESKTDNLIILEIQNISKKIILKEIVPIFKSNAHIIECSISSDLDVRNYLKSNLPKAANNLTMINSLISLYEGNFSFLINDLKILEILNFDEEQKISEIFNDSGVKKNSRLIEFISKKDTKKAIDIIESMKRNDRNSIGLLIWILVRDCHAISLLKTKNGDLKSLNIWGNQTKWYETISNRASHQQIKDSIYILDKADKSLKGVISGDPWIRAKDAVMVLSA